MNCPGFKGHCATDWHCGHVKDLRGCMPKHTLSKTECLGADNPMRCGNAASEAHFIAGTCIWTCPLNTLTPLLGKAAVGSAALALVLLLWAVLLR